MKLTIREDSKNYACTIVHLPPKQAVQGLDKLVRVNVFGNDVLTQKDTPENELYLFFPAECCIANEYLSSNNEFRHSERNIDRSKTGFFEDTGRVKAIKFKGVISTGYIAPLSTLKHMDFWKNSLDVEFNPGDEFTDIDGINICKKYRPVRMQGQAGDPKESRFNKKLKRFDKLVANQFRFHQDTSPLARNMHQINPDDIIVITDKWHGTSAVFSKVLIKAELTWWQKIASKLVLPSIKKYLQFNTYGNLYASRSVIKNQYINKDVTPGYYNEDIWGIVNKEVEAKIEQGITLYGEIVGYLPSGKEIQKGYDYGCTVDIKNWREDGTCDCSQTHKCPNGRSGSMPRCTLKEFPQHKFLVYRITYTKPDGSTIEFSWQQIKDYCQKYALETVKELYFGKLKNMWNTDSSVAPLSTSEEWLDAMSKVYLEKDCTHCKNKVPAEGVCVRVDGRTSYMTFKFKAKRFLERETKQLDAGVVDIEDEQTAVNSDQGSPGIG